MKFQQLTETKFVTKYPSIEKTLTDKANARFQEHLSNIQEYLKAGELIKAEFARIKDINRFIEETIAKEIREPYWYAGKYESLPEHIRYDLDTSNVGMHTIPGKLKKALALQKQGDHPALKRYIELMNEFMPLHLAQKELKGMIVAKKAAAVSKEKEAETEKKFQAGHKDVKKVKKVLTDITKQLYDKVYKSNLQYIMSVIDHFWTRYDPAQHRKTNNYAINARNPFHRDIVNLSIKPYPGGSKHINDPDKKDTKKAINEKAEAFAKRMTDEVLDHFINKQTAKLADILTQKNNLKIIELIDARTGSGVVEGLLKLAFKDGSSFHVNNKVVWGTSKLGKVFHRFPTTFHQVVMPTGERMKGAASEARMRSEFSTQ